MRIQGVKTAGDFASYALVGTTLLEWAPRAAAVLAVIWWVFRIWETETVKGWTRRK